MDRQQELRERQAVVAEALSWVGTPYHHEADVKGRNGGVDCGMLLVRSFVDTGVVAPFDPRPYPQFWYLHRDEERYLGWVLGRSTERLEGDAPQPGDVVVWRHGRCFSHGAIVTDWPNIVHAFAPAKMCLPDSVLSTQLQARPSKVFNPWGK